MVKKKKSWKIRNALLYKSSQSKVCGEWVCGGTEWSAAFLTWESKQARTILIAELVRSSAPMAFSYFTDSLRNDEPSTASKAQVCTQTWTAMIINEKSRRPGL